MKKFFYSVLVATTMMFATTSCSQDEQIVSGDTPQSGSTQKVSFKVEMPVEEASSRAIADGVEVSQANMANKLAWALYEKDKEDVDPLYTGTASKDKGSKEFTVSIDMVKGLEYKILFLAYNDGGTIFDVADGDDLKSLEYKKDENGAIALVSNQEAYDAFVACHPYNTLDTERQNTVYLTRPFAQINAATTDDDLAKADKLGATVITSQLLINNVPTVYNVLTGEVSEPKTVTYTNSAILKKYDTQKNETLLVEGNTYNYLNMVYVLAGEGTSTSSNHSATFTFYRDAEPKLVRTIEIENLPIERNYRTNVIGDLITQTESFNVIIDSDFKGDKILGIIDGKTYIKVNNAEEFNAAFKGQYDIIMLGQDIVFEPTLDPAADPEFEVTSGKTLIIDLNGKKLSSTSSQTGNNYNLFDVRGTLTVKNGTMEYEHKGSNMGWNNSTNLFNVTAGGVLNLEGVTAKNLGGSDMGFVAHLNNWGEVTLNVENSTLESNYVPVRVFNSGNDMNNVTIKNSTLKGGSNAFWVHNYTVEDFGSQEKADAHKALLNLNIFNQGNTFSPDPGIRFGFTNSIKSDAYGIYKTVSEDGTVVTLGSVVENGLIRRGVAGAEENQTIKKVVIGEGVTTLYDRTFRRFYALETVELPSTLTTIGEAGTGVFQSCSSLKNITLPESLTTLGVGSFYGCTSLSSINIPAGVSRIEENCLRETALVEVEFHAGVTYFGSQSFRDCKQLKKVVINAPKFTIEANAFGVMAGTLPGTTIYVANAEMKAYLEETLSYKNQFTIIAPESVSTAEELTEALSNGQNVVLQNDIYSESATTAPYGNKYAYKMDGGELNGNGYELYMECYGDDYGIMTSGGTIKNLTIKEACRAIMLMYANEDVILDNVKIGGDGVLYPINTGEEVLQGMLI